MATGRIPTTANSPLTAKGDLFTFSTGSAKLAVGSNGDTLVADSSTSTGLRYTAGTVQANPVLNSAMQIFQRGTTSASITTTATYTADRWALVSGASTAMVVSRQATGDTTNLPFIQYCSRVQRTAAQTGVSAVYFAQSIESTNSIPFVNKTVTLSFYARKGADYSSATSILNAVLQTGTGTDQNILSGGLTGAVNAISQNATLTTTWQRFSYTGTIGATATQLAMFFSFTPVGTAGAADYFELTGVQIDIGSVALPFRTYAGTLQGELAACQRYYYRFTGNAAGYAIASMGNDASSTTAGQAHLKFPVTMRIIPSTLETAGTWYYAQYAGSSVTLTALTWNLSTSPDVGVIAITAASGLSTTVKYQLLSNNTTASYVAFSAEL
jgi:hypothetical protein